MRFTTAWSEVVAQNTTLKLVIALLTVLTACLGFTSAKLSMREPLVIERACYSQAVPTGSTRRTEAEIEAFNREMLRERFDSGAILVPGHLSSEEEAFRKQEQEALKTSNMTQRIVVNSVKVDKESISVDADRIISVGQIRSAFPFPLTVMLSSTSRTEGNPYGLTAVKISPVKKETGDTQ